MGPTLNRPVAAPRPSAEPGSPTPPDTAPSTTAAHPLTDYFAALGVPAPPAQRLIQSLDARIDPSLTDPSKRKIAMLEALDRWAEELPSRLGAADAPGRVAFVWSMHMARLLEKYPDSLEDADPLLRELGGLVAAHPQGLLPAWPTRSMDRQPLGELPGVLRGEFWSGTYRWVMPTTDKSRRPTRDADLPALAAPALPAIASAPGRGPGPEPAAPREADLE
ncbi:MAG: hypothetical protein AAGG38_06930 [Planctomycetota bacterium]